MYIPVYHTNGRSIKNKIGMVMNRLVGMGLKAILNVVILSDKNGHNFLRSPIICVWSPTIFLVVTKIQRTSQSSTSSTKNRISPLKDLNVR